MGQQKRSRKVGRPKMPKGEAKGRIVPVRFTASDLKTITAAAKASNQTVSEWLRSAVMGRNLKTWYAYCPELHIPLFEAKPSKKGYCDGCGVEVELQGIGEGYVSHSERAKGRADPEPLSNPDSTPPPTRL